MRLAPAEYVAVAINNLSPNKVRYHGGDASRHSTTTTKGPTDQALLVSVVMRIVDQSMGL